MTAAIRPELDRMLRKAGPGKAHEIVELYAVVAADIKSTKDEWDAADSLTGLNATLEGEVKLAGTAATTIEHAAGTDFMTDLNNDSPFSVAKIAWTGGQDRDFEIREITAYLHPKRTGAAKEVAEWQLQLKRLHRVWPETPGSIGTLELMPLGSPIKIDATGTVAADFTFDFKSNQTAPKPKLAYPINPRLLGGFTDMVTYVFISALKSNGEPAGNVGWGSDSGTPSKTTGGNILEQATLTENASGDGVGRFAEAIVAETPRIKIVEFAYSPATIAFTGAGNKINVLANTDDHVVVAKGRTPSDSAIVYKIKGAVADALTECVDGDLVGVDNTPQGGKDLSAVTKKDIYTEMRAELTDNTDSDVTPVLEELGIERTDRKLLHDRATIDVEWALDPFELRGLVAQATIDILRDGRLDFHDEITQFLMDHDVIDIGFRLFIGHPDLDRNKWRHVDDFPFIRDYDPMEDRIRFFAVSALAGLKKALPVATGSPTVNRDTLIYDSTTLETLKAVYDDLVDGQVGLAGRHRGPGIEDAVTTVRKTIGQKQGDAVTQSLSDAKRELDGLSFVGGGGLTTDRGKVRFANVFDDKFPEVWFPEEEIDIVSVSPGLSLRMPEVFLAYDYDFESRQYAAERRGFHTAAINAVGVATLDTPTRIPDSPAQWVDTQALAESLVERHLDAFALGVRSWRFRSAYAYPELRIGQECAIETRAFAMRDPINNRELRGRLWAIGIVVGIHDAIGSEFTLWIRDLSDILATNEAVVVEQRKNKGARVYKSANQVVTTEGSTLVSWNTEVYDDEDIHDNVTNNERLVAHGPGKYSIQGTIEYQTITSTTSALIIIRVVKNGVTQIGQAGTLNVGATAPDGTFSIAVIEQLVKDDYVWVEVFLQTAGGGSSSITLAGGAVVNSAFEMVYQGR